MMKAMPVPRHIRISLLAALAASAFVAADVAAQDNVPVPAARPQHADSELSLPAKQLFGAKTRPSAGVPRSIGGYADGCQAGAVALPITGKTWQVMRLSRNRNWGQPGLVRFIERLGARGAAVGWPGLLVGDMAQPRGGPMVSGHASHQIGLDVDIWLEAMPGHELLRAERESMAAPDMVAPSRLSVDRVHWTPAHSAIIRAAAQDPAVERIFVNAAIKKHLCAGASGDRAWLEKVRPWYLHNDHFHVRLHCPPGSTECKSQPPVPPGDGCNQLAYWFSDKVLHPKPGPPGPPRKPMMLAQMPAACRAVLAAPDNQTSAAR